MDDDTPIIVTVVASVHIVPSQWAEEFTLWPTRANVVTDVRSYFECDPTTGAAQRVLRVSEDGPAFPPGMRGTTTGPMLVNWTVADPQ